MFSRVVETQDSGGFLGSGTRFGSHRPIGERGLTQTAAAKLLGIDQPKVSQLFCGDIRRYTIDRLVRFVTLLQHDVRIRVGGKRRRGKGKVTIEAA